MNVNDYQDQAGKTAIFKEDDALLYTILSLAAEAGEVASKYSKIIRDNNGLVTPSDKLEMAKELGDVQWNVAICARSLGYNLETICTMNLAKLNSRLERGVLGGSGDNR
jgi:NTP pyrophosphatase (non-canonical NTP hydrolase)